MIGPLQVLLAVAATMMAIAFTMAYWAVKSIQHERKIEREKKFLGNHARKRS